MIGAAATMFFPFMSQGFLESTGALVGANARGTFSTIVPVMSIVFGAWLLLIVFYFYRRRDKQLELIGKLGGAVAGAFAALKYNIIASIFVRFLGSGASLYMIGALIALSVAALVAVAWPSKAIADLDLPGASPDEHAAEEDALAETASDIQDAATASR